MVIAVASLDASNNVSGFSNFGTWVDVSAYGSNIYSTVANGGYSIFSGTSMASPMVAGLAALMVSYSNSSSVDDIINCLLNSANDEINDPNIHPGNLPGSLGVGVIDAYDALRCIGGDCSSPLAVIFPSSQTICPNESITLSTNPCINHLWSTGETTSEITVFQPGNYSVTITYSGGCTASSSIEIHAAITNAVMIIDEASGLIEGDGIICGGGSANTVNLTAWWGESYSWNIFGATSQSITGLGVGTDILPISYNYSVTVTNVGGCTGVTDVLSGVIKHLPLPDAQIFIDENSGNPNNGIICLGESVTLSVPIIAGNSYIWNNGNTTNSITVTPAFTTVYTVTVTNTNGCTNQNTATVILDCELDDCGCPANSIVISNQNSLAVLTGTGVLPQNPTDPVNLIVLGNLHIDITTPAPEALNYSYTFPPNSTICMNENARIIIFPGCSLKLDRTTIKGCEKLWENIIVNDGGKLVIDNLSTIQDARLGVTVEKMLSSMLGIQSLIKTMLVLTSQ